ncbi:MAG: glycerophosphodiester phosphodiesterase [Marinilabiliales bacterium]|nr:MAG: glycerophosphodiester phosphodiesterase [Marinilabiliales bacterium]
MLIIAHRGASGFKPENTITSFLRAIELEAKMIEFDVHVCKSGEAVVIHDFDVDRTTNGKGIVSELTLDALKKFDAGDGEQIPTLDETLNAINGKSMVNIEIKGKNSYKIVAETIKKQIDSSVWEADDFLVSSFNHKDLLKFHKLMPEIKIGVLFEEVPENFHVIAQKLNAYSINADTAFLSKEIVENIHLKGYKIFAYTVNNEDDKIKMEDLNVDGIFTNYP